MDVPNSGGKHKPKQLRFGFLPCRVSEVYHFESATGEGCRETLLPWAAWHTGAPTQRVDCEQGLAFRSFLGSFQQLARQHECKRPHQSYGWDTTWQPTRCQIAIKSIHKKVSDALRSMACGLLECHRKRTGRGCETFGGSSVPPDGLGHSIS